ncbi:MAG: benzoyl-CoA 2,3-epoxidase subunit BoxA [Rhizobiaceae bacterium]|nr:benzoyl-CoA 2,3-epoxidase subunit BoxA [Rhizobiaceae bacterium]MCV0404806.1 benzoyl-CoA 2,3-epoxidase subunit BoxA [Rhizobiaceae bacterium]
MNAPVKQHLIDPEICIRCHTCEEACPIDAITHDDNNVVVDASICNFCMNCIAPCPTGSIDNWRVVATPYSLEEQLEWIELPPQEDLAEDGADGTIEALDDEVAALLAEAHAGAGGAARAPASASKPSVNLFTAANPAVATVQGNWRLTAETADSDVRHIILDLGATPFPILEGQSVGIAPPGTDANGRPHRMRLYSVSSPRDGERPNTNNLALTVKREPHGVASNYVCDLKRGDQVRLTGPFGSTFLMPNDASADILMICTGTGSAPFRGFTMRRQRTVSGASGRMTLVFGARTPDSLPYFGPLKKVPDAILAKHLVFSRVENSPKEYVQDRMRAEKETVAAMLKSGSTHVYVCGLKAMEAGVEQAFEDIARGAGLDWKTVRDTMRAEGRYHVETY